MIWVGFILIVLTPMSPRITKVEAYLVNLMDNKGERLMSGGGGAYRKSTWGRDRQLGPGPRRDS